MNAEQRRERAALLRRLAANERARWAAIDTVYTPPANAYDDAIAAESLAAEYETNDPATWSPAMVKWGMNQLHALGEILGIRDTMTDADALQHARDVVARAGSSR